MPKSTTVGRIHFIRLRIKKSYKEVVHFVFCCGITSIPITQYRYIQNGWGKQFRSCKITWIWFRRMRKENVPGPKTKTQSSKNDKIGDGKRTAEYSTKSKPNRNIEIHPWFVGDSVYHCCPGVVAAGWIPSIRWHAMGPAMRTKMCRQNRHESHSQCSMAVPNIRKTVEWNVCNTIINQTLNYPRSNSSMPTQFCSIFVFAIRYSSVECVSIHLSSTQCATVTLQLYHICSRSVYSLLTFSSRSAHVHFSFASHSMANTQPRNEHFEPDWKRTRSRTVYVESHWYRAVFPMRNTEWTRFAQLKGSFASREFNLKSLAQFSVRENGYFMPFGDSVWVQLYSNQHRQLFGARIIRSTKRGSWNGHRVCARECERTKENIFVAQMHTTIDRLHSMWMAYKIYDSET